MSDRTRTHINDALEACNNIDSISTAAVKDHTHSEARAADIAIEVGRGHIAAQLATAEALSECAEMLGRIDDTLGNLGGRS